MPEKSFFERSYSEYLKKYRSSAANLESFVMGGSRLPIMASAGTCTCQCICECNCTCACLLQPEP